MALSEGPLAGIRVLDLADQRGELAGRLLADLGAEVLKIEPPGGAFSRRFGPFDERANGDGMSLVWAAVALGKKSAVLDIETPDGREQLGELAKRADILVESFTPGYMASLGLGYGDLASLCPRLIYASVSAYGQTGPKSLWPATDITVEASGARLAIQGDRDRPPVPIGFPQGFLHAGAQAAADAVIALNERELSGRGQHLDTSAQECMIWTLMGPGAYPSALGIDPPGAGDDRADFQATAMGRLFPPRIACKDGIAIAALGPGMPGSRGVITVVLETMRETGELPPELAQIDWNDWGPLIQGGDMPEELLTEAIRLSEAFIGGMTKQELVNWTIEQDMRMAPIHTTLDVVDERHLSERNFWVELEGDIYPGPSARLARTPIRYRTRAPVLGAHQVAVDDWMADQPQAAADIASDADRLGEAFAGLKVADFSWVAAGPTMGKALADNGATVVRIESSAAVDLARNLPPFAGGEQSVNASMWMALYNTSKKSCTVNLGTEEGRALAHRFVHWADVVLESYSPGTMARFGLDYDSISKDRPDLIMLSTSLLGQTGPYRRYSGYGQHGAAFAGIHSVTGWPDRDPCGASGPYTDVIAPKYGIAALASAILERRRSGLGQNIDVSQIEASVHFIEPFILDQTINGRTTPPQGMHSPSCCPHGVYATLSTERYVAVSVETDAQWQSLVNVMGYTEFTHEKYSDIEGRRAQDQEIDAVLAEWCADKDCWLAEALLVEAGVPASVAARPSDLHKDPQLAHRGFYIELDQADVGPLLHDGPATHFSAKDKRIHSAFPSLGEHTESVLRGILQLSDDEIAAYESAGALR